MNFLSLFDKKIKMKTLTYISKYHFIKIGVLLIGLMWSSSITAQSDSTVTYTFNDTTMTFNLEDIRQSLLNSTDLSPQEVEATLSYEPFWKSMFPPPPPNPNSIVGNSDNVIRDINDPIGRSRGGPPPSCLEFDNSTEGEVMGNTSQWTTECACASGKTDMKNTPTDSDDDVIFEDPYTYHPVIWTPGIDCYINENCPQSENPEACQQVLVQSQDAFTIIQRSTDFDPYVRRNGQATVIQMNPPSDNQQFIRIGDQVGGSHVHKMTGTFKVSPAEPILKYSYAVAMQDTQGNQDEHGPLTLFDDEGNIHTGRPYLTMRFKVKDTGEEIPCADYSVIGVGSQNSALDTTGIRIGSEGRNFRGLAIDWTTNVVDLNAYLNQEIEVEVTLAECNQAGHTAWAYLDFSCEGGTFAVNKEAEGCSYNFTTEYTGNYGTGNETYTWDFGDGTTSNSPDPSHTYSESGDYDITLTIEYTNFPNGNDGTNGETCEVIFSETVTICCDACESSFAPLPGEEYVISAWVKENITGTTTYNNPNITLQFEGSYTSEGPFRPSGAIIDGWQRIESVFTVPYEAEKIKIKLNNDGNSNVFFDDVRVHPFDASMKSFVYDPVTLRLSAELDERNYATYYEYDEEGALIRIKKETERGVMTIQEARNGIRKAND